MVRQRSGDASVFERLTAWHSGVFFVLAAIASAKTESKSLCRWLDNKLHSFLLLLPRTVTARPHLITGKMTFFRSLVCMPTYRLLMADLLAVQRAAVTQMRLQPLA